MKDLIYIHIRILYFNGLRDFIYSYNGIVFFRIFQCSQGHALCGKCRPKVMITDIKFSIIASQALSIFDVMLRKLFNYCKLESQDLYIFYEKSK